MILFDENLFAERRSFDDYEDNTGRMNHTETIARHKCFHSEEERKEIKVNIKNMSMQN